MATQEETPLDEVQWRSPQLVQQMGGIHTNTVLPYFSESPFFDRTSNNATLSNQALYNPAMLYVIQTRQAFEAHLRSMSGLEFMVVHDPSNDDAIPTHEHSGVWVIRKQIRRKQGGGQPDSVEPISTYFVVGENVYMAPTVGGILGSRLLSAANALSKLVSAASTLPIFNPALGHVYSLPAPKPVTAGGSFQTSQASKEPTPMPEAQAGTTSLAQAAAGGGASSSSPSSALEKPSADGRRNEGLLAETIANSVRWGREYMDEHPLLGEPGAFIIQKAKELQVPVGKDAASAATAADRKAAIPLPPPLKTDLAAADVGKKTKGGEKSPLSPTGSGKKRKKSKVQTPRTPKTPGVQS